MNLVPFIKDGIFCWTLTSNGYKYYTWNLWLQWTKEMSPRQPLCILCADKPSYQFLQREGIPCRLVTTENQRPDFGPQIVPFGSRQFASLNRLKLTLLDQFSKDPQIQTCVYLDGDIAVYRNFLPDLLERLTLRPLLFQCDETTKCSEDTVYMLPCKHICTGLIAFQHGAPKEIFQINDTAKWQETPEDQVWVNYTLQRDHILFGALPRELYPNGSELRAIQQTPERKSAAYLLHYNYRVGDSKRADMRRYGDWVLPY